MAIEIHCAVMGFCVNFRTKVLIFMLFNVRHINVTARDTALMIVVEYPLSLALVNGYKVLYSVWALALLTLSLRSTPEARCIASEPYRSRILSIDR